MSPILGSSPHPELLVWMCSLIHSHMKSHSSASLITLSKRLVNPYTLLAHHTVISWRIALLIVPFFTWKVEKNTCPLFDIQLLVNKRIKTLLPYKAVCISIIYQCRYLYPLFVKFDFGCLFASVLALS